MELSGHVQVKKEELSLNETKSIRQEHRCSPYGNVENLSSFKGPELIREGPGECSQCPKY